MLKRAAPDSSRPPSPPSQRWNHDVSVPVASLNGSAESGSSQEQKTPFGLIQRITMEDDLDTFNGPSNTPSNHGLSSSMNSTSPTTSVSQTMTLLERLHMDSGSYRASASPAPPSTFDKDPTAQLQKDLAEYGTITMILAGKIKGALDNGLTQTENLIREVDEKKDELIKLEEARQVLEADITRLKGERVKAGTELQATRRALASEREELRKLGMEKDKTKAQLRAERVAADEERQKLQALRTEKDNLEGELRGTRGQREKEQDELESMKREKQRVVQDIGDLRRRLGGLIAKDEPGEDVKPKLES
ncbi:hypothetical protein VNI00_017074 [Paramarasmius palmivorus]|uniref:Uncharacterized protein n=1 Tax=Paramarasmius palmivorus TaxID=297713 RepID=A0AAW0B718_9AGAR